MSKCLTTSQVQWVLHQPRTLCPVLKAGIGLSEGQFSLHNSEHSLHSHQASDHKTAVVKSLKEQHNHLFFKKSVPLGFIEHFPPSWSL